MHALTATAASTAVLCGLLSHASAAVSNVTLKFASGNVRVQALSTTLLRVEPEGPMGFEDRTTFAVYDRNSFSAAGTPPTLKVVNQTTTDAYVATDDYTIHVISANATSSLSGATCASRKSTDVSSPVRTSKYQNGAKADNSAACCALCTADDSCVAWVFVGNTDADDASAALPGDVPGANCWPLSGLSGLVQTRAERETGCTTPDCGGAVSAVDDIVVTRNADPSTVVWSQSSASAGDTYLGNVNWPSPGSGAAAYGFQDHPRFFAPDWGPTPIPASAKVDPALVATNGYDFRNNVVGDTYIFLFPSSSSSSSSASLDAWYHSRHEFLQLTGPVPLLPDYAYGTWFTYWHQYTEDEAKGEVTRWKTDDLPIDVWALDMNWRNTPHGHQKNPPYQTGDNHLYNHPNTELFPDFANNGTGWFDWLQAQGLRTYFNDHPFPADDGKAFQTTADEVNFRWDGLSHWMDKGLTYWWFDANWAFSIPPPQVPYGGSGDGPSWQGMDNRVWGSHVYHTASRIYNELHPTRNHTAPAQRPMALTKYADGNMHPGLVQHQHAAHHRYPVWWTGDGVDLQASVQSMVDSGVHDFKPFVHSDCGGDYRGKVGGDLLRWAAHCTFGTILRFHGNEHQPWSYDNATESGVRTYLKMRYTLVPSLIAAGHQATQTGFPIVARADLFWPEHAADGASSNEQYLFLNDTLVAPIWDSSHNETSRQVWIPPGTWQDAWSGAKVSGPVNITSTQPYERIPMWHKVGGLVVTSSDRSALRIDDQDWSDLTLEAFLPDVPANCSSSSSSSSDQDGAAVVVVAERTVYDHNADVPSHFVTLTQQCDKFAVEVTPAASQAAVDSLPATRSWTVRLHLPAGSQKATVTALDGEEAKVDAAFVSHLLPLTEAEAVVPFGGKGTRPAPQAGTVVEVLLPAVATAQARKAEVVVAA